MGKKFQSLPDDAEFVRICVAAGASAASKLQAATALLAAELWPEAFYNAALGLEEIGKAYLCLGLLTVPPKYRGDITPKEFTALFNGHSEKASLAHMVLRGILDEDAPDTVTQWVEEAVAAGIVTNDMKFRALYAEPGANGTVLAPSDVTEAAARWVVERLGKVAGWLTPTLSGLDEDPDFLPFVVQARDNLDAAVLGLDEDGLLSEVRGAIQGGELPQWLLGILPAEVAAELAPGPTVLELPAADSQPQP
jgi:AbiV family abortive infection protein